MNLRQYQIDIIQQTRALMTKGVRSILIQSPCGSGKTLLTAHMLKTAASRGMSSWFCCHRRELISQSTAAFAREGVRHGIISAGFMEDRRHLVQIASVQTLIRRHRRYRRPKLIIVDECTHIMAASWSKLFNEYKDAFIIGLTASPERLDGKGLRPFFSEMVAGPSVTWLIENKFLAPYKLYAPSHLNLTGVHERMGDFIQSEVVKIVDKPSITGNAISHYKKYCNGKRAIVFCASINHSKNVVEQFNAAGVVAEHVDGGTERTVRDNAIKRFAAGEIKILSNVELFSEGLNIPAIEAAIMLRPTTSLALWIQQSGRALRTHPGKIEAIIIDAVGNCSRLGLPDEDFQWNLDGHGERYKKGENSKSVRICGHCFAAQFSGRPTCQFCGFIFEKKPREIDQKEGELSEVDKETLRRHRAKEQGSAGSLEELYRIGVQRGYRQPRLWAKHVFNARQARKLAGMI